MEVQIIGATGKGYGTKVDENFRIYVIHYAIHVYL